MPGAGHQITSGGPSLLLGAIALIAQPFRRHKVRKRSMCSAREDPALHKANNPPRRPEARELALQAWMNYKLAKQAR